MCAKPKPHISSFFPGRKQQPLTPTFYFPFHFNSIRLKKKWVFLFWVYTLAVATYCSSSWHCESKDTHVHVHRHLGSRRHAPLSHMNCELKPSRWGLSFGFMVTIRLHGANILTSSCRFITSQMVSQGDWGRPTQWPILKGNPCDKSWGKINKTKTLGV